MSDLGSYLKDCRETRGWTLREAAKRIGVSPSRLTEIERGKSYHTDHETKPSRELIERIAKAYDLDPQLLLADAGYPVGQLSELSEEARLVQLLFDALSPERKYLAIKMLRVLMEREQPED